MLELFYNVIALSVSMIPVISGLLILAPLLNKIYIASWKYWIWLAVSLRLLIPFSGGKCAPLILNFSKGSAVNLTGTDNIAGVAIPFKLPLSDTAAGANHSSGLMEIVLMVYFAGVATFLLGALINYFLFCRKIRRWKIEPADSRITKLVSELSQSYGLSGRKSLLPVFICRRISVPMVFGFFKPVLFLPVGDYDDRQLRMILSHEIVHLKRRDLWYKLILLLVCSLHWFNPAVHIMIKRANWDLEISCDNIVLQGAGLEERKLYSFLLLEMAANKGGDKSPVISTGFESGKGSLESRIKGIFEANFKKKGTKMLAVVILTVLVSGGFVQINSLPANSAEIRKPVQSNEESINPYSSETTLGEANSGKESKDKTVLPSVPAGNKAALGDKTVSAQSDDQALEPPNPSQSAELVIIDLEQLGANTDSTKNQTESR